MIAGYIESPNSLITRKNKEQFVIKKDMSYEARILLIGLISYSKTYGYTSLNDEELEKRLGIKNVSKNMKQLDGYIRITKSEDVNERYIYPNYFDGVTGEEANIHFKSKIKKTGFTPLPKIIMFNRNIKPQDRLTYAFLLRLTTTKEKCYPTYSNFNIVLGLSEKSRSIVNILKRLEDYYIEDNDILKIEDKEKGRGKFYYPLLKIAKVKNKYRVVFLDENELELKEVQKTRGDLVDIITKLTTENEVLRQQVKELKEKIENKKFKTIL